MFDKQRVDAVLAQHGMHPDGIVLDAELEKYKKEMQAGLAQKDGSSLMMLPTYIGTTETLPAGQRAIVIDAGGTNLRIGKVRFLKEGGVQVEHFDQHAMPGSLHRITKEQMFDAIAAHVAPLLRGGDHIGFCFSFVFEPLPDHDGVIEAMSKEVQVTDVAGACACAELEAALLRHGAANGDRHYVMINDTVATLLGAKAVHTDAAYASFVGMILGTGLNACYIERTANIGKLAPGVYTEPNMVINMESGIYTGIAQGAVDREVDSRSKYPGDHVFEKMISGGYFGDVLFGTLKLLCGAGVFSADCEATLMRLGTVSLKTVTTYIKGEAGEDNIYQRIATQDPEDGKTLEYVLDLMYLRCAKLVTVMLCGIAEQADVGNEAAHPLCVCAEGTTFYRSPLLTKHLDILLREYVAERRGRYIKIVRTDDATLIGTALAALTN